MEVDYNGCGGYSMGKYQVLKSCGKWIVQNNLYDTESLEEFETLEEALDYCLNN